MSIIYNRKPVKKSLNWKYNSQQPVRGNYRGVKQELTIFDESSVSLSKHKVQLSNYPINLLSPHDYYVNYDYGAYYMYLRADEVAGGIASHK